MRNGRSRPPTDMGKGRALGARKIFDQHGLPRRCYRPLAVDGGATGSKIGGRIRNSWVPGGGLDPLTPNSMRRGAPSCGTVLAGGDWWSPSPTEGGGYWSAPSSSAHRASTLTSTAKASAAADK